MRWLALFPFLYVPAFLGLASLLQGTYLFSPFMTWQRIFVRLLAALGCFLAVSCFERGDHLRRAWLWLGVGTVVIMTRDLLRLFPGFSPQGIEPQAQVILTALGILSNLALLGGIWLLARAWKMAAITLPGGRSGFGAVAVITAVLALAVVGPGALQHAREVAQGDWSALVLVVSAVVDIVTLCLITPLLLTAISLRGSLFAWPWVLITASQLSWLLYDAAAWLAPSALIANVPVTEVFRHLAEVSLCFAGLSQYLVIQQVRRAVSAPAR